MLFEKIVCLNLDHRLEDGVRLENSFRCFDVSFQRFVVGKGALLPPSWYSRVDAPAVSYQWANGPYHTLPNSYHAFLAFQHILHNENASGTRSVLLLEDDAVPVRPDTLYKDVQALEVEITRQNLRWDMLYLGCNHSWSATCL